MWMRMSSSTSARLSSELSYSSVTLVLTLNYRGTLREVKSILADVAHVKIDAGAKM